MAENKQVNKECRKERTWNVSALYSFCDAVPAIAIMLLVIDLKMKGQAATR